ncbi:integrase domain-containing protein [Salinivibrio sp. KP-1]|uniref:integrase domain-containing protein n=1 Tax=Salinivibrio sp. KP-1 TaxID=1406902 RepID=UPI0006148511|nr:integrase domain-containing protein [Salinivibrio sp. KP-1]KKA44361.1 integrase [Salinivibrio sp. KP-1]
MAKIIAKLTDKKIKAATPEDKEYLLYDGDGLRLRVKPTGSKLWLFNYLRPFTKKRTNLSLGAYPTVTLSQARKATMDARALLAQNIDPKEHREEQQRQEIALTEHTVEKVAYQWFELKKEQVTEGYATDIWRSLERHIFPKLGATPLSKITAPMVIDALKPIEASGSLETLKRLVQRLNEMMNYAVNCGLIHANPLSGIGAAFKKPKKNHMAALTPDELPELMQKLAYANIKRVTRCLIEWQLHTMTRPAEAAAARWDEIDWDNELWIIPAERTKKRREHRIPLTEQMLAILEVIKPISGHRDFIFPSDRDPQKPCNSQTANMALKRMGFADRLVSHGLRSLASTTLNEQGFDADLIESALAHVDDNQVRSAYNRTDYIERRRPMMCWWSGHIEQAAKGSLSVTGTKQLKVI